MSYETVARVRICDGETDTTMRIGLSPLATAYLGSEVVRDYLQTSTECQVSAVSPADAQESPFVSETITVQPPLTEEQLEAFGEELKSGRLTNPNTAAAPEALMLIDSRGKNAPRHFTDDGSTIHGGNARKAEIRFGRFASAS